MAAAPTQPSQMTMAEFLVADALWEIAQDHQLQARTAAGAEYCVTGDIIDQMARAAIATLSQWDFSR